MGRLPIPASVPNFYKSLGSTIRQFRNSAGLTQSRLAEEINLSRASVVNIEQGRHHPQIHILYLIANALKCQVSDILPTYMVITSVLPDTLKSQLEEEELGPVGNLLGIAKSDTRS